MDCERAHERLLRSDDPARLAAGDAEVARHVAACADCRALVDRLARIEQIARALPVPEGSGAAKRALVERLRSHEPARAPAARRFIRPALVGALAALLVVGIGLTAWMEPDAPPQQTGVVEQLIDFDLALAEADPAQREQLYARQAPGLRSAVRDATLSDADRQLATAVLEKEAWLGRDGDPIDRAERLGDWSDLLVGRLGAAAAANDEPAVRRLGQRFGKVQKGLGAHLGDLGAVADVTPGRTAQQLKRVERLERIAKRQEAARQRLEKLAEKSPRRARRALQRMLENAERQREQGKRAKPSRADPILH